MFCRKWYLSELETSFHNCLWTGSAGRVLARSYSARGCLSLERVSCLPVSKLMGQELYQFTHCTAQKLLCSHFELFLLENREDGTLVWNPVNAGSIFYDKTGDPFLLVSMNLHIFIIAVLVILSYNILIQDWIFTRNYKCFSFRGTVSKM